MMQKARTSFQGVTNIVRFNWHFYVIATGVLLMLFFVKNYLPKNLQCYVSILAVVILLLPIMSLAVSWYVYDYSGFYKLGWMNIFHLQQAKNIVIINAGFDETSELMKSHYPNATLHVFDFYDPAKHTEISIQRARKAYPAYRDTLAVTTDDIPLITNSADDVFLIFAAHEIRNNEERLCFFREAKRVLSTNGNIVVVEHLRNINNFIAFNIGFLHFYSGNSWRKVFSQAGLRLVEENKFTPFVTIFTLQKNDPAP